MMDGFIMRKGGASGGGSADLFAEFVSGTISGFIESDAVTALPSYTFANTPYITGISFPNCTSIAASAFSKANAAQPGAASLTSVYLNGVKSISFSDGFKSFPVKYIEMRQCTSLRSSAFRSAYTLESISIPACTEIPGFAFDNCSSLKSVYAPLCKSIAASAFASCSSLKEVEFPACTYVSAAFNGCSALTKASFPALVSIQGMIEGATTNAMVAVFTNCKNIEEVYMPKLNIPKYSASATVNGVYQNNFTAQFPSTLKKLTVGWSSIYSQSAFLSTGTRFPNLEELNMPECKAICQNGLISLSARKVYLPKLETLSAQVFRNCMNLSELDIPLVSQLVGDSIFESCSSLTAIKLSGVTKINGNGMFNGCSSLSEIYFDQCELIEGRGIFHGCWNLKYLRLPNCTSFHASSTVNLFSKCSALSQISFSVLSSVEANAFAGLSALNSVSLPACEYLGSSALFNCTALGSITLPNMKTISSYAFSGCTNLSAVYLPGETVVEGLTAAAFANTMIAKGAGHVYVPRAKLSGYQSKYTAFSSYFSYIA